MIFPPQLFHMGHKYWINANESLTQLRRQVPAFSNLASQEELANDIPFRNLPVIWKSYSEDM